MLARATTATPWGIEARPVQVEVDVHNGMPQVQIVGLPDTSVRESRERVRSAIKNCGFDMPPRVIVINLAPADLKKEGNHLDLGIALALLAALEHVPQEALDGRLVAGELGLDGTVRPVRGGLAIADLATECGFREVLLPRSTAPEAAALDTVPVVGVDNLPQLVDHLLGENPVIPEPVPAFPHWVDADGDGCNTRYEVLIAEADDPPTIGSGCSPRSNGFVGDVQTTRRRPTTLLSTNQRFCDSVTSRPWPTGMRFCSSRSLRPMSIIARLTSSA